MAQPRATGGNRGVHPTGTSEDTGMSKQHTAGRESVDDAELDWDAVLQDAEQADEPAPAAPPAVTPLPAAEPERPQVVSLGAGWSVVPGPGRWGGTLRISDAARARAAAAQETADAPATGRPEAPVPASGPDRGDDPESADAGAPDAHDQDDRQARGRHAVGPGGRDATFPQAPAGEPARRPSSEDLTPDLLVRDRRSGPRTGLRGAVYRASGRTVNLGPSAAELRERELLQQIRVPISGCFRVAVISLKGGVGKTTVSFCLGATLASLRGDRVIAIDANPDVGTLAEHVLKQTRSNVWDLLADPDSINSYAQVRGFTSQSPDRLEVLASARDPQLSHAFDASDYERVMTLAERFYTMVVTDCGTGMVHSAMTGVLASVDQLVLVSSASLDGARSASATLDWLEAQGHGELAARACVVVNSVRSRSAEVDVDRLAEHFLARSRAVVTVPYDPHLAQGTTIELAALQRRTRQAWVELAAGIVADRG